MRKRISRRKFSRPEGQRKALLKNLSAQLFLKEKIKTTEAKAKELKRFAERYITKSKKGGLMNRRRLLKSLPEKVVSKLIGEIAPRYKSRQGGYTRIIKLSPRQSDGAKMAIIELVERVDKKK